MLLDQLLARGRALAEALMVDACRIRRRTGATTDPATGTVTPTWITVYEGPCRFQQVGRLGQRADVAEASVVLLRAEVHLPLGPTVGLAVDDEIEPTRAQFDPDLIGRVMRVHDLEHKTAATARRVQTVETTG
ncbi:hypothetical protein Lfu02_79850 [Longispora fulva]|uniref:Uncharacterized protein n=1 Tax=Longispora fulva TaxID=619741 RepID=A0A8J7KTU7_9ACTN|nr:DUF6093 family protein [Longispora fulva]MBG6141132.1 hypothetical protein [Longispora fulva]GIG63613.1 hypothetical protein Lfu02_79850 [Longispora fulva]